jgi:hypothetical protein
MYRICTRGVNQWMEGSCVFLSVCSAPPRFFLFLFKVIYRGKLILLPRFIYYRLRLKSLILCQQFFSKGLVEKKLWQREEGEEKSSGHEVHNRAAWKRLTRTPTLFKKEKVIGRKRKKKKVEGIVTDKVLSSRNREKEGKIWGSQPFRERICLG